MACFLQNTPVWGFVIVNILSIAFELLSGERSCALQGQWHFQ